MNKIILVIIAIILFPACTSQPVPVKKLIIKGSDTMLPLVEMLAAEYMKLNPEVSVYCYGGGTLSGVKAIRKRQAHICTASRKLKPEEIKDIADEYGTLGVYYLIGKDALSVYLNEDNPVDNLTMEELKKIYTCEVKKWNELGGDNSDIVPIVRTPNSGTYSYFKRHVLLDKDYCDDTIVRASYNGVFEYISNNRNSIGFGGIKIHKGVKHVNIDGVEPTENNIMNDTYPIIRYLHFYTVSNAGGETKEFIDWTLSPEGQKIIKKAGFVPLFKVMY
jgi:phosphate transport system substrate-binding protein